MRVLLAALVVGSVVAFGACGAVDVSDPVPSGDAPPALTFHPTFGDFATRVSTAQARYGTIVQQVAEASSGSNEDLALAAEALDGWATEERLWWEAHDVDECYAAAFGTYGDAIAQARAAAAAFARLAAAPEPPTDEEGQEGVRLLGAATNQFAAAASLAAAARGQCQ